VARTFRKLGRAVIIGAATIFVTKRPYEHWSTPPTAVAPAEHGSDAGGQGSPDEPTAAPPLTTNDL
jgi:hypothetical protein